MANFADSSNAAIAVSKETTFGVNPGSGAVYARFTSDTLEQDNASKSSAEVTGDRNPRGLIRTDLSAKGDINFEFSANNFDILFEGMMTNHWTPELAISAHNLTISGASLGTFTVTDATGGGFANAVLGQWVKLGGFATNGIVYGRIIAKASSSVVTCQGTRSGGGAVTNEVGTANTLDGSHLSLGTTKTSFTIERQWLDVAIYELFTGMTVSTASMKIAPGDIMTGKFSFLGSKQVDSGTSAMGSIAPSGGELVMNAVDNVEAVMADVFTRNSTFCFTEITFDMNNKLRLQHCIGSLGAVGIGLGVAEIKGTLKAFLEDMSLINEYLNFTLTKLSFRLKDQNGRVMIFTFPQIRFGTGRDPITGNAADGVVDLSWTAEKEDGISNSALTIDRFNSADYS